MSNSTQKLATLLLDEPIEQFVRSRRPERAWRLIARDIYEATNGEIDVTPVTLAIWFPDNDAEQSAAS